MTTRAPQVSVVIPTRNRRALLERALASALRQRHVQVEVIVVDEASGDGTAAYLHDLGEPRVSTIRHEAPRGVAAARNEGLARASAPWIAFLDDDDIWAPDKLAAQLDAISVDAAARWSCVGAVDVDEDLGLLEPQLLPSHRAEDVVALVLAVNAIPGGGSGVLAETALVRSVGGFDEALSILADWDLWIRLALRSAVAEVDRALVAYLRHDASMTTGAPAIGDELRHIESKYAAERDRRGVELAWEAWLPYIASMQRRAGLRAAPASLYARLAAQTRNPFLLLRAVGALVRPEGIGALRRRGRRPIPEPWRREADAWLAPLREQVAEGGVRS